MRKLKVKSVSIGKKRAQGFSLIELLIVVGLSTMLLAGIWQVYFSAKSVYRAQQASARWQENLRFATNLLSHKISMAGFSGCRKLSEVQLVNHTVSIYNDENVLRGYGFENLPSYLIGKVVPNTDVLVLQKADNDLTQITSNLKKGATTIWVTQNPASENNQILLISDCMNADLLVANNWSGPCILSRNRLAHAYQTRSTTIGRLEETTYFIGDTGRVDDRGETIDALFVITNRGDRQELIEGIDSMRISYGVDSHGVGAVDKYYNTSEMSDLGMWVKVLSVVISLHQQGAIVKDQAWKIYVKLQERK